MATYNNGTEALADFVPGECDVAILDLGLPDIAGDEIARTLRDLDPNIGLILVSGWRLGERDPRLQPFDFYLPKPFAGLSEIRATVGHAMDMQEKRKARLRPALQ